DLYASAFGPFAATTVVQDKNPGVRRLLINVSHYELVMAYLGFYLHGDGFLLALIVGLAAAACGRWLPCPRLPTRAERSVRSGRSGHPSCWWGGRYSMGCPERAQVRPASGIARCRRHLPGARSARIRSAPRDRGVSAIARFSRSPPVPLASREQHVLGSVV